MPNKMLFSLGEAAKYCGVSRGTINRWEASGQYPVGVRPIRDKWVTYHRWDLDAFKARYAAKKR